MSFIKYNNYSLKGNRYSATGIKLKRIGHCNDYIENNENRIIQI